MKNKIIIKNNANLAQALSGDYNILNAGFSTSKFAGPTLFQVKAPSKKIPNSGQRMQESFQNLKAQLGV